MSEYMGVEYALELMRALRLPDGRQWGEAAVPVQVESARAVLDIDSTVRRHWDGRARGFSKTEDAGGWSLVAGLCQMPPGSSGYLAAADSDQARLVVDSLAGFVRRSPAIAKHVQVQTRRVVFPARSIELVVLASDSASAYGLRPHWLVLDELCQWPTTANSRAFYEALMTALPKMPRSRAAIITTAGDPSHWSRQVLDQAAAEPALWRVSETHGPPPWMDPALIAAEERRLPPSLFRRLFMNEWAAGEDRLTSAEDVRACVGHGRWPLDPQRGVRYVGALDVGLTGDRTVFTIAHLEAREAGATVVVDAQWVWTGTPAEPVSLMDVGTFIREQHRAYRFWPLVVDPYQAELLKEQMNRAGIRADSYGFTEASVGRLALTMYRLLREHLLDLPDDPDLIGELIAVRLVEKGPGRYRIDHRADLHDDRVISLALCAQALVNYGHDAPATTANPNDRYRLPASALPRAGGDTSTAFKIDQARNRAEGDRHQWQPGDAGLKYLPGPHRSWVR